MTKCKTWMKQTKSMINIKSSCNKLIPNYHSKSNKQYRFCVIYHQNYTKNWLKNKRINITVLTNKRIAVWLTIWKMFAYIIHMTCTKNTAWKIVTNNTKWHLQEIYNILLLCVWLLYSICFIFVHLQNLLHFDFLVLYDETKQMYDKCNHHSF